jgi:parallel beta-helix repeat protein
MPKAHLEMGRVMLNQIFKGQKAKSSIAIVFLAGFLITESTAIGSAAGSAHRVSPGENLQEAINAAKPGDTIEVASGTYNGPISVTKRLILRGIDTGSGKPVIDAGGKGSAIILLVEGSVLEGFLVGNSGGSELEAGIKVSGRNMTVRKNTVIDNIIGMRLQFCKSSVIEDNEFRNNDRGIFFFGASGNTVKDNSLEDNTDAITIWDSNGNTVEDNKIFANKKNGIYLVSSSGNYIADNNASGNLLGIYLMLSESNIILGNKLHKNGDHGIYLQKSGGNVLKSNDIGSNNQSFYAEGMSYDHLNNDIDISNLIDGRPIYYLVDASNRVIDSSSMAGTVYCIRCRNITVKNLTMERNDKGIYFYQTAGSLVENNTVRDNSWYGIELHESDRNLLKRNSASRSKAGIYLENSSYNTISANNAFDNTAGIVLAFGSGNNTIYQNNMVYNENYCP